MLYLFATLFISATLGKGSGGGKGSGHGGRGSGHSGKGSGHSSCTVTVEEQNTNLDTFLAPFTSDSSDDSTTCHMRLMSSSWPHEDAVGATRRLLYGSATEVDFDVSGKTVSTLQVNDVCLTTTSFTVSSVEFNYAVEVEESMAEEVVAEDSSDCDSDSDSSEVEESMAEEVVAEETTEGDATEDNTNDLVPLRRNLGDSEESNRAYAVLTLTQTNSNVSFDLTVQCGVRYSTDADTCTPAELTCKHGDYSYNVAVEGAESESVESHFMMVCAADDSSDICPAA